MATDNPIRLTYLITDLNTGGVPLHLYRLATRLPRDRFDIRVISLADVGPVGRMLQEAGIEVRACHARSAMDLRALWRLYRLLRKDSPDILHALLFHANIAARMIGPLAGVPIKRIICEIQTVERERLWHLAVDNLTCRLCRAQIGNSPSVVDYLARRAHIPRSRLQCMWGAVDVERIQAARPATRCELDLPEKEPVLIWVGRLDPVKGFEQMIEGVRLVNQTRPVRFLIVGNGPYKPEIERLIVQAGLQRQVLQLGERQDVASLLRLADVFVFCSKTEGLPNAVLEAMAAELPIVATNVPGCRDLVRHCQTGLLVPPGDGVALAEAILRLLDDRRFCHKLGRQAGIWIKQHADICHWPERWQEWYTNVL